MVDTTTTAGVIVHRCYVCGGPIVGPTSYHTDKGATHGSCLFPPDHAAELAALGQRIEELERGQSEAIGVSAGLLWDKKNAEAEAARLRAEQPELIAIAIMQGQQRSADEIKRLREALECIADRRGVCAVCGSDAEGPGAGAVGCDSRSCEWSPQDPRAIARAALGRKA